MNEFKLPGCTTRPLSGYLKALAVFRLIAEQKDKEVMACWDQGAFRLRTRLGPDDVLSFFCREYVPTPIITPWNGGSGFYPGDSRQGIDSILQTDDPRFNNYKQAISSVLNWPEWARQLSTGGELLDVLETMISASGPGKKQQDLIKLKDAVVKESGKIMEKTGASSLGIQMQELESLSSEQPEMYRNFWNSIKKARTKYNDHIRQQTKSIIIPLCRSRLPDYCLPWLDALCAIHSDGSLTPHRILGTYGNDGRLEFGNNFMKSVSSLLLGGDSSLSEDFLRASLLNKSVKGLPKVKAGQFDPGRAGGYNQGMGIEAKDFKANPWDYVLTLEGALVLASSVVRRQGRSTGSSLTSPFTVRFSPVGFTSSEYTEPEGGETEIWMPLWEQPASFAEVSHLFSEGRSSIGRRQAGTGLDFSRAVGTLGVDRGITAFERYGFLKRRGDNRVALPAGKIPVRFKPSLELFTELDPLLSRVDQFMRGFKNPPASYIQARRQIDEDIFSCTLQPDSLNYLKVIRSLGRLERLLALRDRSKDPRLHQPLYGLSPQWINQADDSSSEMRIASAISSIRGTEKIGTIRSNMAGVSGSSPWQWDEQGSQQHWFGSDFSERMGNIFCYRLMDAERKQTSTIPLQGSIKISPYDLMPFLNEETDDVKIEELLWGLTLIDLKKTGLVKVQRKWEYPIARSIVSRTWCLLKLLHIPGEIRGIKIKRERSVSSLLLAGRTDEACDRAIQRLRITGLQPFPVNFAEEIRSSRLLASLIIPVKDQHLLEEMVLEKQTHTGEVYV